MIIKVRGFPHFSPNAHERSSCLTFPQYLATAVGAILLYDYILTFLDEVRHARDLSITTFTDFSCYVLRSGAILVGSGEKRLGYVHRFHPFEVEALVADYLLCSFLPFLIRGCSRVSPRELVES